MRTCGGHRITRPTWQSEHLTGSLCYARRTSRSSSLVRSSSSTCVKEYSPQQVLWQFGLFQSFPLLSHHVVSRGVHRMTRMGAAADTLFTHRMQPWAQQWDDALEDRVTEYRAYDHDTYEDYIEWFAPRTRLRVGYTPAPYVALQALVSDIYPSQMAERAN